MNVGIAIPVVYLIGWTGGCLASRFVGADRTLLVIATALVGGIAMIAIQRTVAP